MYCVGIDFNVLQQTIKPQVYLTLNYIKTQFNLNPNMCFIRLIKYNFHLILSYYYIFYGTYDKTKTKNKPKYSYETNCNGSTIFFPFFYKNNRPDQVFLFSPAHPRYGMTTCLPQTKDQTLGPGLPH